VLDAEAPGTARELAPGKIGALAVKLPLPPGALTTLWQADDTPPIWIPFPGTIRRRMPGLSTTTGIST
jgi:hypothetical protein